MNDNEFVKEILSFLEKDLVNEILKYAKLESVSKNSILIREGQYLKHLPVVLDGSIKVYNQFDGKEMLLYFIKPKQSCITSFAATTHNQPSRICAVTEKQSKILLLPASKIPVWASSFPRFNQLFFDLYHQRYLDLLETITQLVFYSLDRRLLAYLKKLSSGSNSKYIRIRHREIARDLGTAREVVTRVLKKLEYEKELKQTSKGIKILSSGD